MKAKYLLTECTYHDISNTKASRTGYGIALSEEQDGIYAILQSYHDLSPERAVIEDLVNLCNLESLDSDQLEDVVCDFLSSVN